MDIVKFGCYLALKLKLFVEVNSVFNVKENMAQQFCKSRAYFKQAASRDMGDITVQGRLVLEIALSLL